MKEDSKSQDTTVDSIPLRSKIDHGVAATQRVAGRSPKTRAGSQSVAADLPTVRRQIIHGDAHGIASTGSSDAGRLAPTVGSDLSFDARLQAVSILQLGCGRETAARYLGLSLEGFNRAANSDADFGLDLRGPRWRPNWLICVVSSWPRKIQRIGEQAFGGSNRCVLKRTSGPRSVESRSFRCRWNAFAGGQILALRIERPLLRWNV